MERSAYVSGLGLHFLLVGKRIRVGWCRNGKVRRRVRVVVACAKFVPIVDIRVEGDDLPDVVGDRMVGETKVDAEELLSLPRLAFEKPVEFSVTLCNDRFIQALNVQYRNKDSPTDVLSFPLEADDFNVDDDSELAQIEMLGDVVISVDTAQRQSIERMHPLRNEMRILLVHGLLHLLGYDHEESQDGYDEMVAAEEKLMDALQWSGHGLLRTTEKQ